MESLLTTDQASQLLSVSRRTLEGWRARGTGPKFHRYSGRCVRYAVKDLQDWLASHSVGDENCD